MDQTRQFKKVKLFRTLKVAFYMLGFPLFIGVVFLSIIRYIGHDPFVGEANLTSSTSILKSAEMTLTSSAFYGLWIALGIWLLISIVHIILSKTVKSPRARMISVVALTMVVMMGCAFGMDAVFESKITEMRENAPAGVVVNDYKTQLSYYRHLSSNGEGKNDTLALINKVKTLQDAYHVKLAGEDWSGTAGNISNKPITYYNIISDDGEVGVDISFEQGEDGLWKLAEDGSANHNIVGDDDISEKVEGNQLVRLAPNANGELVINGKVYSHYNYAEKWPKDGSIIYVWYTKDMYPVTTKFEKGVSMGNTPIDGIYGEGLYNSSGLMSDGWVFSLENVLAILEDYYEAQETIARLQFRDPDGSLMSTIREDAVGYRDDYYNGLELPNGDKLAEDQVAFISALYNQEVAMNERFSLTKGELDLLVSKLGGLLGKNSLFDYLLSPKGDGLAGLGAIADIIQPILDKLANGMSLGGLINNADTMTTVIDIVKSILPKNSQNVEIHDLYILLAYAGKTDALGVENREGLYLAIVKDSGVQQSDGSYVMGTDERKVEDGGDVLIDIDFRDVLQDGETDPENPDYVFDLDHLSAFLNNAINGLLKHFNINLKSILVDNAIGSLIGGLLIKDITVDGVTYKGLEISGISIPLFDQDYNAQIDVSKILENLLSGLYSYQSSVFKPIWEFYECQVADYDETVEEYRDLKELVRAYAQLERANYEATVHGKMIGSVLLGDTLGTGAYPSSFGLNDLASVRQMQSDLSYKPVYYPLYSLRDMLMLFSGFVILFYFLSFVAHEKEIEYATGKLVADKKQKKGKKIVKEKAEQAENANDDQQENADEQQNADAQAEKDSNQNSEDTALPVNENTEKEVR